MQGDIEKQSEDHFGLWNLALNWHAIHVETGKLSPEYFLPSQSQSKKVTFLYLRNAKKVCDGRPLLVCQSAPQARHSHKSLQNARSKGHANFNNHMRWHTRTNTLQEKLRQ